MGRAFGWAFGGLFLSVGLLMAQTLSGQDPINASPDIYRVVLENDRVRVLDIRLKPGQRSPMHTHPDFLVHALSDSTVRFTKPDGTSQDVTMKAGDTAWNEAVAHAAENIGATEAHVLNIELK